MGRAPFENPQEEREALQEEELAMKDLEAIRKRLAELEKPHRGVNNEQELRKNRTQLFSMLSERRQEAGEIQ